MMADRVHHAESPAAEEKPLNPAEPLSSPRPESHHFSKNFAERPKSPPESYVIQVPKDQIYRVPPPENAHRFESYARRSSRRGRRSCCCCCLAWTAALLLFLLVALAAAAGILYLIFKPKIPKYSVDGLAVKGFNLSTAAAAATLSPEFDVTVRADNPNEKIGIYYRSGSSITVSYDAVSLCQGVWPTFYQGKRNVTVFETSLTGSGIRLSDAMQEALVTAQRRGEVPLEIDLKVPVRVKFGAVTTSTITVNVWCDVTVDKLTADSKIVSKSCSVELDPF